MYRLYQVWYGLYVRFRIVAHWACFITIHRRKVVLRALMMGEEESEAALPSCSYPVNLENAHLLRDENKRGINSYTLRK